jgi:hypothetical protein
MLVHTDSFPIDDAQNILIELEHFYTGLKSSYIGIKNGPTSLVDRAWHWHILNTQMYLQMMFLDGL